MTVFMCSEIGLIKSYERILGQIEPITFVDYPIIIIIVVVVVVVVVVKKED